MIQPMLLTADETATLSNMAATGVTQNSQILGKIKSATENRPNGLGEREFRTKFMEDSGL